MAVGFMRVLVVAALLTSVCWTAAPGAQSLGAIAQREAERRKQTRQGKRYTNEALRPEPAPSTSDAARTAGDSAPQAADATKPSPGSPPSESSAAAAGGAAAEPPKAALNEAEWRAQARERRARLQRFRSDITALESRLAELEQSADVSPEARSEQQALAAPLASLRSELAKWAAEFGRFEQRARAANVPADWIQ
jgi:hypothetical protein